MLRRAHVLILSDELSPTVDGVVAEVERRDASAAVLSVSSLPARGQISVGSGASRLRSGISEADLTQCVGVWSWHPELPVASDLDVDTARYVRNEWRLAVRALTSCIEPARWINAPAAASWIEGNKLVQQRLAKSSGFLVPETLLTNDPDAIDDFAANYEFVAVKSQGGVRRESDPEGFKTTFTQKCSRPELRLARWSLTRAPVLIQPYIDKSYEVRVTVVDDRVFACRIDSQASTRTSIDWRRYDFARVKHEWFEFSDGIRDQIEVMVKEAGLRYAALDFIVDKRGDMYFLDMNPSGQFAWIERLTGAPITQSLVEALLLERASG